MLKIVGRVFLVCCLFFSNMLCVAAPVIGGSDNISQQKINNSQISSNGVQANQSLSSSQLGWSGPFAFGINYDNLNGYSWNAKYTQKINNKLALSGLFEHGSNVDRVGGTVGFNFLERGLLKFSAERLSEVLPFNFDSGSINKRVAQNAFGSKYQYNLNKKNWQDISFGGYYADTPSETLDPITFHSEGVDKTNYRRIAGATSKGVDFGSDFRVTESTELTGRLYYDYVHYNTSYIVNPSENAHGLGGSIGISQLIGKHIKLSMEASKREIYDTYNVGLSWLPPIAAKKMGIEISLMGKHFVSHNQTPNSNGIALNFTISPGTIGADDVHYQLPDPDTIEDIGVWTSVPAVHMDRVLAIADQKTEALTPTFQIISPSSGSILGGESVKITGKNFSGATSVTFGGVAATSLTVISATEIDCVTPSHVSGNVNVLVTTPNGTSTGSFEYLDTNSKRAPSNAASLFPTIGPNGGNVGGVISGGSGYNSSTIVKFKYRSSGTTTLITPSNVSSDGTRLEFIVPPCPPPPNQIVDVTTTNPTSSGEPFTFTYFNTRDTYLLSGAGSGGSISPLGNIKVPKGTSQTFTVAPDPTYHVEYVLVDGLNVGSVTSYTFSNIQTSHSIYALFSDTYPVTSSVVGAGGSISPAGVTSVIYGSNQNYTITSDANHHVSDVLVDGISIGPETSHTFTNVTSPHTITASFSSSSNSITANVIGTGGSVSPSGATLVNYGADQAYTITSDVNHHVADVLVDGVSIGAVTEYTFTNVIQAHTITASFSLDTNPVTANVIGTGGSISPSGVTEVPYGSDRIYTIATDPGYNVADLLVDGVSVGAATEYTFTNVKKSHTIAVSFSLSSNPITANVTRTGGIISPSGITSVNYGASQGYTITPDTNRYVVDVLVDGVSVGALTAYDFTNVTKSHTISVNFSSDNSPITASVIGTGGAISPSGSTLVGYRVNQSYTITPDANYHVADVVVDGVSVGAVSAYTFTNVTIAHTISVSFSLDTNIITSNAGANGSISPSGTIPVNYGANQSYTITPATNYHVADVLVDGVSVGAVTTYTFANVTRTHTISASFSSDTAVIITSNAGANGSISPSGAASVNYGANQSYTITPVTNYHVADVLVDGVSVGALTYYTFTNITKAHTITASFSLDTNIITSNAGVNGSISPSGATPVNYGENQSYTIFPNSGYNVADVLVDGVSVGALTSYTFTNVTKSHTITASFSSGSNVLTSNAGANGSISPSGYKTVSYGADQSYTITPATNCHVADVLVDGVSVGAVSAYAFSNVTRVHTIYASFAQDTNIITSNAGINGSISPSGETSVSYGTDQSYTITPATNYHVADVLVDGVSVGTVSAYTFTNVTRAHTISASFSLNTNVITSNAGANGSISPLGAESVTYGANQSYTVTPDASYHVADVVVDGASVGAVSTYTFTNITTAHTITASFSSDTNIITSNAGANGSISPSGATSVTYGANQSYTMSPDSGYSVADVLVDGVSVGALTYYTFTNITKAHTISVSFSASANSITANAGANGTISLSGVRTVSYGAEQSYTITPATNYKVADVLIDGVSVGAITTYRFTNVTKAHTISVSFSSDTSPITSSVIGTGGAISPSGATLVSYGANQSYTITPTTNYKVADVLVDGVSVGAVSTYTFTNVTKAHTIYVSFSLDPNTITSSVSGTGGSISPSGATSVNYGANQSYTLTPDANYHVADVVVDGVSVGAVSTYTFTNVTKNHTISATFSSDSNVITSSAGINGSITPSGATPVNYGDNQNYTMTPDSSSYYVSDVLVDGISIGAVTAYTFTNVTKAHTISVSFSASTNTITSSAGANGSISPSGSTPVNYGANQSYTITPNANYYVADVLVDGVSIGAVTAYTFTNVTKAHTISVSFSSATNAVTSSVIGTGGSISPVGATSVVYGAYQNYSITPDAHYYIADVLVDGVSVGAITSYTFTNVTQAHTISVSFSIETNVITSSAGEHGSISPSGTTEVNYGADQTYTITHADHYHVADILVNGSSVGAADSYTFTNVTSAQTISVSFSIDTNVITSSAGEHGSISPSGTTAVNYGADQTYTITHADHYHVADILVNGSSVGAADSYTFTNVTSAQTISVSFAIDTKVITSSAGEHGEISPSGETLVGYGSDKTYTMIPSTNYHVADVLVDGKSVGAVTSYTFKNIESDHTISVTFDNTRIITSSVIGTGGSINPLGNTSIINGADQNYTITPIALYHIADVLVDGLSVGAVASYTFTNVTSAHTISVRFSIDTNDITASAGDHGSISPSGDTPVNYGADQTFTITPDSDFSISDVIVDGVSKGAISSYTFSNVVVAHTITASFVQHIDLKTPSLSFDQISDKSHKFISISKNKVSVNGGQKIKIKFDKFHEPPTEVLFDNVRAKMISSAVDMVVVIVPAHKLGTVDITISNSKELITLPKAFVYLK